MGGASITSANISELHLPEYLSEKEELDAIREQADDQEDFEDDHRNQQPT